MTSTLEYTPPWNTRSISFTIYKMYRETDHEAIIKGLKTIKGDIGEKQEGWLVDTPLLRVDSTDQKISCFVYISFRRDNNVSKLYGDDYLQTEPIGCVFDFKNKLIIAMTTRQDKLILLENEAFIPIQPITLYRRREYNTDFPFWLSYMLSRKEGEINKNISVKDFFAIISGRDVLNLRDSVASATQCTSQIEAKLILGINGTAKAASFKVLANGETHSLLLHNDGRVKIRNAKNLESLEEKVIYAEEIDNIIEIIYTQYQKAQTTWATESSNYQKNLLAEVAKEVSEMIKTG